MNVENFKKGIKELKNIRMTEAEKKAVLRKVFSSPVESPYMERIPVFAVMTSHHTRMILTGSLVLALSFSGVVYGSDKALPGDLLYPVKTKVIEPMFDVVNREPARKIVWEEEKVARRIVEAEKLLEKDELDDEKLEGLEQSIEKSSFAFSKAADSVAFSTGTSTLSRKEKANNLKREFRGRINERGEALDREEEKNEKERGEVLNEPHDDRNIQKEKIKRLQNAAIKVLDDEDEGGEDDNH